MYCIKKQSLNINLLIFRWSYSCEIISITTNNKIFSMLLYLITKVTTETRVMCEKKEKKSVTLYFKVT